MYWVARTVRKGYVSAFSLEAGTCLVSIFAIFPSIGHQTKKRKLRFSYFFWASNPILSHEMPMGVQLRLGAVKHAAAPTWFASFRQGGPNRACVKVEKRPAFSKQRPRILLILYLLNIVYAWFAVHCKNSKQKQF